MRIKYKGTKLLQIIKLNESRPIEFVYLNNGEFNEIRTEALDVGVLKKTGTHWFTINNLDTVFYLDTDA